RGLVRARDTGREVDRDDLAPVGEQRLVDSQEVADRGLGGGRQLGRRAEVLVVVVEVGHLRLAVCRAVVMDVEADLADALLGDEIAREVVRRVGDDGDLGHGATLLAEAGAPSRRRSLASRLPWPPCTAA